MLRTRVTVGNDPGYQTYNTDSYNVTVKNGVVTCFKQVHISVTQDKWLEVDTLPARLRSIKRDIAKCPLHCCRFHYRKYRK